MSIPITLPSLKKRPQFGHRADSKCDEDSGRHTALHGHGAHASGDIAAD